MTTFRRCNKCNSQILSTLQFCPRCGTPQTTDVEDEVVGKNPYEILEVRPNAEVEVIEAAYKSLAKKYHPDMNIGIASEDRMKDINWAYQILSNKEKRAKWDDIHSGSTKNTTDNPSVSEKRSYKANETSSIKHDEPLNETGNKSNKPSILSGGGISILAVVIGGIIFIGVLVMFYYTMQNNNSSFVPNNTVKSATIYPTVDSTDIPTVNPTYVALITTANAPVTPLPLLNDDFSTNKNAWNLSNSSDFDLSIVDNAYQIGVQHNTVVSGILVVLSDVIIEADVKPISGDGYAGLTCRMDAKGDNFYFFAFSNTNQVLASKFINNTSKSFSDGTILDGYKSAIKPLNETNHISLKCLGNTISGFLNGQLVFVAQDSELTEGGEGFIVSTDDISKISFDNFALYFPTNLTSSCIPWNQISRNDVGKNICVTGTIVQRTQVLDSVNEYSSYYSYRFTKSNPSGFMFITNLFRNPPINISECVNVIGVVEINGQTIYMKYPLVSKCVP